MSSNPDQQNPEPEAESASDAAPHAQDPVVETPAEVEAVPESRQEATAEFFAAKPLHALEPDPVPAPEPAPAAPEPVVAAAPQPQAPAEDAPLFRSITSGPRKKTKPARPKAAPSPLQPRELEPEAGDFDAVFEARSDAGLGDRLTPTACYLLMLFSPLTLGAAAIPAVVLAYMNRETAPAWMAGHYVYQIRTFWAAVLIALAAIGTIFFWERGIIALAFGVFFNLVLLLGVAWFVLRAATGVMRLRRGQPIKDPRAWGL
jgi:uncharacterized membrane protein